MIPLLANALRKGTSFFDRHSRPPFAYIDLLPSGGYLANDQSYDVFIELFVPVSERNLDLGSSLSPIQLFAHRSTEVQVTLWLA